MFVFELDKRRTTKSLSALLLLAALGFATTSALAQSTRRQRRETNANRQARINRTITDTYTRRWEIYGGGGYLRFRSGEYLKRNNEVSWAASGTYFLNPKLGITGNAQGSFGNAKIPNVFALNGNYSPQINEYVFSAGPTYRIYMKERYAVSAVVTGGIGIGNFNGGSSGVNSPTIGLWESTNRPVVTAGVNFDYNFYPNLSFRITPTLVGTTFIGTTATGPLATGGSQTGGFQPNLGFNAGFVYRFGRIKQ